MKFKTISNALTSRVGRQALIVQKHSPKILFAVGVIGVAATVVLACKATLKLEGVLDDAQKDLDKAKEAKALRREDYSDHDYAKDVSLIHIRTGLGIAKLYGPSVVVGFAAVGALVGSHAILSKRNVALTAAYASLEKAFNEYRRRVVTELGEEKERELRFTSSIKERTEVDENGNEIKVIERTFDPNAVSPYGRIFDQLSKNWSSTPEYNLLFLRAQQNFFNDLLQSRGHVFLNEVYDALDIERSQAGAVVGWVLGRGDNYIDFHIYDVTGHYVRRDLINGNEPGILLDFNVAGVIFDVLN